MLNKGGNNFAVSAYYGSTGYPGVTYSLVYNYVGSLLTPTPTFTPTPSTPTATNTSTPASPTATNTFTPVPTNTFTPTSTFTFTITVTPFPTFTPTANPTLCDGCTTERDRDLKILSALEKAQTIDDAAECSGSCSPLFKKKTAPAFIVCVGACMAYKAIAGYQGDAAKEGIIELDYQTCLKINHCH